MHDMAITIPVNHPEVNARHKKACAEVPSYKTDVFGVHTI